MAPARGSARRRLQVVPLLPALCENCGAVFVPKAIEIRDRMQVSISNVGVNCPHCGGNARIPDGLYQAMGEAIRIVATSARSAESLRRLQRVLENAQRTRPRVEDLEREIAEIAPELRGLARHPPGVDLVKWITLLLVVIQVLIGDVRDAIQPRQELNPELIEQIVQKVIDRSARPQPTPTATPALTADSVATPARVPRVGRNERCPCGSGEKYKRCHGR